jgi:hypothetical protein
LAVTEKKQAKTGELVLQAESEFKKHIAGEQAINDVMRLKALLGNKHLPIDGETVWACVKEYKARIINCYQVIFKDPPPAAALRLFLNDLKFSVSKSGSSDTQRRQFQRAYSHLHLGRIALKSTYQSTGMLSPPAL